MRNLELTPVQRSSSAYSRKICGQSAQSTQEKPLGEEKSSLFTHLDSINEDEELSFLGGKIEDDKPQLNRYIEVLQIKRKEMDTGKKSLDLLTLAANKLVWPMDAPLAEKNLLGAKSSGSLS